MGKNTSTNRQSRRSIAQFCERLEEFWWTTSELTNDTGEDIVVKVFDIPDDGLSSTRPSGLSFHAQVKSLDDPEAETGALEVRYRFRSADLVDWEDSQPPVVLVVWNVSRRVGHWVLAQDAVRALDETAPEWRSRQTTTVRLPLSHTTDDEGLRNLRRRAADLVLPSYRRGRPLSLSCDIVFPSTADGQAQARALQDVLDYGEPATISGQYITSVRHPAWFERLYGDSLPEIAEVTVALNPLRGMLDAEFQVRAPGVLEGFPLKLQATRKGLKELILESEEKASPLSVRFVVRETEDACTMSFEFHLSFRVRSARAHAAVVRTLMHYQRGVPLDARDRDQPEPLFTLPPGTIAMPTNLPEIAEALEHLLVLERYMNLKEAIDLRLLGDGPLALLRALARGYASGSAVEGLRVVIRGADPTVRDVSGPAFSLDHTFAFMGGALSFAGTIAVPTDERWKDSIVVNEDGTLSFEFTSFFVIHERAARTGTG
jgi:hypothetical protein